MRVYRKRGQITIFIIIGIVLLLSVAIFFYIRSIAIKKPAALEEIPQEFNPVRIFVQDCLKSTAVDGFRLLGSSSGYIYPKDYGITAADDPTNANGLFFFSADKNAPSIAYWDYFSSRNTCSRNCRCDSKKPPLSEGENSIKSQLEKYIAEQLKICLAGFKPLKQQGFEIQEAGEVEPSVTITKTGVNIFMNYPLKITKGDSQEQISTYYTDLKFNFMRIYDFASQITRAEQMYYFFERWTMELIDSLGGYDKDFPKHYAVDFSSRTAESWSKIKAEKSLKENLLAPYIPLLRVYNTKSFYIYTFPDMIKTGFYKKRNLPIGSAQGFSYADLDANFYYLPDWPIYFDITGRGVSGDYITAEQGSAWEEFFSFLGLKKYHYAYDVSYPVVVEIKDMSKKAKDIFGKSGYKFLFALESNIRDNEPLNCSGPKELLIDAPAGALLCNRNHWKSDKFVIETIDARTKEPLPNVKITYSCGPDTACNIGAAEIITDPGSPYFTSSVLETKLPSPCAGGFIITRKFDYMADALEADTIDITGKINNIKIELEPIRTVNATIVKKSIRKGYSKWRPAAGFYKLLPNEKASITLERIKKTPLGEDFFAVLALEGDEQKPVQLVPGEYKISGTLIYELPAPDRDKIIFKDEKICPTGIVIAGECIGASYKTMHIDPFDESFIEGGIELDSIEIPASYLDHYNTLTFKLVSIPDSSSFNKLKFSDVEQIGAYAEWSEKLKNELIPEPFVTASFPRVSELDNYTQLLHQS